MMSSSVRHWLSLRIRLTCIGVFVIGCILPPYIPHEALAQSEETIQTETSDFLLVEDGFLMKSSSLTEQGSRRAFAEGLLHTVQQGESINQIADKYHISADTIRWANPSIANTSLKPGSEILILPVDGVVHTVSRGQTLSRIAELYGISTTAITEQNSIEGGFILAGQELIIPGGKPIVAKPTQVAVKPTTGGTKPTTPTTQKPIAGRTGDVEPVEPTSGVLQMPCNSCYYTQYFNKSHYAVDIQQKGGGPIFAAEAGTVIRAENGWNGGYGNVIEIDHGNGLVTLYGHNKELLVKVGDKVERGQQISWMGNSGRVYGKTGIHVHFEVRVNGVKKNPILYLQ